MYKLLIVDDEPIIRKGLRTIINWPAYNIEICGEAENGREGLRLCLELKPDLVIVDIKMPGMDGLQLIEEVRNSGAACDFIVLSGYSEFAFAQKAIRFGVSSYLLKPIEQDELEERVEQLRKGWQEKNRALVRQDALQQWRAEKLLQQALLGKAGDESGIPEEDRTAAFAQMGLPWSGYQVVLFDDERRELDPSEKDWVRLRLQEACDAKGTGMAFTIGRYAGAALKRGNCSKLSLDWMPEAEERYALQLALAFGPEVNDFDKLSLSFAEAQGRLKQKFRCGRRGKEVVPEEAAHVSGEDAADAVQIWSWKGFAEKAARAVEAGNRNLLVMLLTNIRSAVMRSEITETQIKAGLLMVYSDIAQLLPGKGDLLGTAVPSLNDAAAAIEAECTLTGVCAYLERQFLKLCEEVLRGNPKAAFHNLLEYIRNHYAEDIKLESLAELFHYNSSYLGKLFKSQTGESFNSYLDGIRIDSAKRLLAAGHKVYEVAELVGYGNVDYFHLKFKKIAGESPSAYREKAKTP